MIKEMKEYIKYNSETGLFYWLKTKSRSIKINDEAGTKHHSGYIYIQFNKKQYAAHRLAWAFHNDKDIINEIDHINGIKSDNRIINLRHVSHRRNSQNQKRHRDGKLFGATYSKFHKKWMSRIRIGKKTKYLGSYNTELEAHNRYIQELNKIDLL